MGPRRDLSDDAAARQFSNANNTFNQFLGGGHARRLSWLNGGVVTQKENANPRPPSASKFPVVSNASTANVTDLPPEVQSRRISSISTSPPPQNDGLQNTVSVTEQLTNPRTPQEPVTPQSPVRLQSVSSAVEAAEAAIAAAPGTLKKRKEMEGQNVHGGPPKRLSISGAMVMPVASPSPQSPNFPQNHAAQAAGFDVQYGGRGQMLPSHARHMLLSDSRTSISPVHQVGRGQVLSSNVVPSQRSQAMQARMGRPMPAPMQPVLSAQARAAVWGQTLPRSASTGNVQTPQIMRMPSRTGPGQAMVPVSEAHPTRNRVIPSNVRQQYQDPGRRASAASVGSPAVPSPTTPNTAQQQFPSPQSMNGRHSVPQNAMTRHVQQSSGQAAAPAAPQAISQFSLPIILPYTRESCEPRLLAFHASRQQNQQALSDIEQSRLSTLHKAIKANDSLFMFIHQMVAQHIVHPDEIPSLLLNAPGFSDTMGNISALLAGAHVRDEGLLKFFADLPCSLTYLAMEGPENYKVLLDHIKYLSNTFPQGSKALREACVTRNYPPLATEMWRINLISPELMDVFFLGVLRQIWPKAREGSFEYENANEVFRASKQALYSNLQGWMIHPEVLMQIETFYAEQYMLLVHQMQTAAAQVLPASPAVSAGNANQANGRVQQVQTTQPPAAQIRPQQAITQAVPPAATASPVRDPDDMPLIPAADAQQPTQPATATWQNSALHQAHLRDPRYEVVDTTELSLLYQSIGAFTLRPQRLAAGDLYQSYAFTLPAGVQIARAIQGDDGYRRLRTLTEDSYQLRLRIVKVGQPSLSSAEEDLEQDWLLKPISWPSNMYYQLNGQMLEVRRKLHHTKDMPVDLTDYVQADGLPNKLEFFANISSEDAASVLPQYAFAVEIVRATRHKTILDTCKQKVISAEDSLKAIIDGLKQRASADGDDDIIIDDAKTNITIYDPICQSKICELPARGESCKHRECFDLLTFLQTRPREKPTWPSEVDAWKCPICLGDVRPHRIVIDGFLKDVREKLVAEGKEKTRAIVVEANGTWTPKFVAEIDSARSTPDQDDAMDLSSAKPVIDVSEDFRPTITSRTPSMQAAAKKRQAIVIDLRDDD